VSTRIKKNELMNNVRRQNIWCWKFLQLIGCILCHTSMVSVANAQDLAQEVVLNCDEDLATKKAILQIRDPKKTGEWLTLVEFSFPRIGWLDEVDSCRAWIISTLEAGDVKWETFVPVRLLASKSNEARLSLKDASEVYPACSNSDRCSLRIPYRWHWSLWRDVFYKKTPSLPEYCYVSPESTNSKNLPPADLSKSRYDSLGYVSSWREPGSNMAAEIMRMTESMRDTTVVVSTMQWSVSQLKLLKEHFTSRNIKAYVIGDLHVWLSGERRKPRDLTNFNDDKFIIIPAYSTPRHNSSHHVKGAVVANKEGDFIFTSSNLTSGDESVLQEFGVRGKSLEFAGDWLAVLRDLVTDYCVDRKRLSCVVPHYVQKNDIFNLEIEEALTGGCRAFFADDTLRGLYSDRESKNRMVWAGKYDVSATILSFIKSAKTSVKATVNQLNRPEIIKGFESIDGIPAMLYVGSNITQESFFKNTPLKHVKLSSRLPHAKAILTDDKTLFWGTGNFTNNGLSSLREIFFATSDQAVVKAFRDYYESIEKKSMPNQP
jgi:hypothetical protein